MASLLRWHGACQRSLIELPDLAQSCLVLATIAAVDDQVANLPQRSGVVDGLDPPRQIGRGSAPGFSLGCRATRVGGVGSER